MAEQVKVAKYPIRPICGRWPAALEARASRWFWPDPRVVLDEDVSEDGYVAAMRSFAMGETIKITAADRHRPADDLLLAHVDTSGADIVDIGASDGSTSVDLIERLGDFATYTIADLHLRAQAARVGKRVVFTQGDGTCFLVAGRRALAWPRESSAVAAAYRRTINAARDAVSEPVTLLGPRARNVIRDDERVSATVHDVFTPWPAGAVDVVKVANLLRHDYFDPGRLTQGFAAIASSLRDGGHLLVANNLRKPGGELEGGLFRLEDGRFRTVATTDQGLDVEHLVLAATAD